MLTAKEAALQHGFSPLDVKVRRSNLVVANAVDLGAERLKQLVEHVGSKFGSPRSFGEIEARERRPRSRHLGRHVRPARSGGINRYFNAGPAFDENLFAAHDARPS